MLAKPRNPIDVYVGGRVRMRRIEVEMSQQILAGHLDLTFQQIQKYEKGSNRIGASRLQQIGKSLKVPAAYFFEGAPGGWESAGAGGDPTPNRFLKILGTRDGQCLVEAFSSISDVKLRRSLVDLLQRLAAIGTNPVTIKRGRKRRKKPRRRPIRQLSKPVAVDDGRSI
jgi:transcriptional regulator with XRE-family HTH domain